MSTERLRLLAGLNPFTVNRSPSSLCPLTLPLDVKPLSEDCDEPIGAKETPFRFRIDLAIFSRQGTTSSGQPPR